MEVSQGRGTWMHRRIARYRGEGDWRSQHVVEASATRSAMIDRVAMISGANRGIGAAIAAHLAEQGWQLSLGVRRPERLATPPGGEASLVCRYDAEDTISEAAWVESTAGRFGRIDAVVANAGVDDSEDRDRGRRQGARSSVPGQRALAAAAGAGCLAVAHPIRSRAGGDTCLALGQTREVGANRPLRRQQVRRARHDPCRPPGRLGAGRASDRDMPGVRRDRHGGRPHRSAAGRDDATRRCRTSGRHGPGSANTASVAEIPINATLEPTV